MAFDNQFTKYLRERVRLSEVISRRVKLLPKGKEFLGLCPFHAEKTPSFTVNDQKGVYYCFGCGAHGDVFNFFMDFNKYNFNEAIASIAKEIGVPLPEKANQSNEQVKFEKRIFELLEFIASYWQSKLYSNKKALDYLYSRGLSAQIINQFRLGYAPSSRDLVAECSHKFSEKELIESGVFKRHNNKLISVFFNRIIFPIFNSNNKVIAFGGRTLGDQQPKYLNSPETFIFHKRATLYALNFAKKEAFSKQELIVTEGYMDTIALYNAHFNNVVASLGTAISDEHLALLWNIVDNPIFCMDGDVAGFNAMSRLSEIALTNLRLGKSVSFVCLKDGMDPDDTLSKGGSTLFRELLNNKINLSEFLWQNKLNEMGNIDTPEKKAVFEAKLMKAAESIKDQNVKRAYKSFFKEKLWNYFRVNKLSPLSDKLSNKALSIKFNNLEPKERYEIILLLLVCRAPKLLKEKDVVDFFENYEPKSRLANKLYPEIYQLANEELEENLIAEKAEELIFDYAEANKIKELLTEISYLLDKMALNSYIEYNRKWFLIMRSIYLESLKEEYKFLIEKLDEASYKKAMEIKIKISELEPQVRNNQYL